MPIGSILSLQSQSAGLATGSSIERIIGTGTSGPRGIEAIIEYNGIYLNQRDWIDTFLVTSIDGIDDADVRDTREEYPGDHGELPGISLYGGRTIVLQGYIETKTMAKMRDMIQGLRYAFRDITREYPLIFHNPDITNTLEIFCKKSQKLQVTEDQTTLNEFKRNFAIYLRASNPRFTARQEKYVSESFSGATYDAIAFTPVNDGNFPAQSYLALTGPFTTLAITNEGNNDYLELVDPIPSDEVWIYDVSRKKFYESVTGNSKFDSLTNDSTELYVTPEIETVNNIHVVATGLTSNSLIELKHHNTYI